MKKTFKRLTVITIAMFTLLTSAVTASAASLNSSPADALANLTGRDLQSVIDERVQTGKTYGEIAAAAGVLEEFKAELLEMRKDKLADRVENGTISQERADAIIERMEANQAFCTGTGSDGLGLGKGNGGGGLGLGNGNGAGTGSGGRGAGQMLRDGSCVLP
ncbi:MAG: hypothetical protein LBU61_02470 [Coriobacteriales bacterium]|jgi:hypothetical protein|nr:hypothetical protein [Coriobacteriales bacterium]